MSGLITSCHIHGEAKVVNLLVWAVVESGCWWHDKVDLVLEITESGVVYRSAQVEDITDQVITRYNAKHGK